MSQKQFALIDFHGDQMLTILEDDVPRVAIKPIVDSIGIDWPTQYKKIAGDPVLSKGMGLSPIPSERGPQETVTLPLDLMQGWLFKLNPDKVKPEARDRLIAYQKECYQVLHDYWVKGAAINPRFAASIEQSERTRVRRQLPDLLDRLESEWHPEKRRILYELAKRDCEAEGIAPPEPEAIRPVDRSREIGMEVFTRIEAMISEGALPEHHRREDRIAFTTRELRSAGLHLTGDQRHALKQHPRFIATCKVNCRDGQSRHCWVFATPTQDDALASALRYEPVNGARP